MNDLVVKSRSLIDSMENEFIKIVQNNEMAFRKESVFALQAIQKTDYSMKIATQNPTSLKFAIMNVASIGITLSPVNKYAYLIPRKNEIVLDISYMGLCYLAQKSGAVKWVQADVVRESDEFIFNGKFEKPTHIQDPFSDRGQIKGAYCIAYTGIDYLVEVMSAAEIDKIKNRSDAYLSAIKKGHKKNPWITDYSEMAKKTVIKRASKLWPQTEDSRLYKAIDIINQHDGIDFDREVEEAANSEVIDKVKNLIIKLKRSEEEFIDFIKTITREDISLENMTKSEAELALNQLEDILQNAITSSQNREKEEVKEEESKPVPSIVITTDDIEF